MSLMFEEKKDKKEDDDVHKPEGTDEGGGNSPGIVLDIASNPGKYILYGGVAAALIYLFTKVRTSGKHKTGVKI